jgi:enoyl-CoA hydratase/carnithine racemase
MFELIRHDTIAEIRLARPPVNALNPELVARLADAFRTLPAEGARAIVLSGAPGLFSAGLDVPTLLTLDRDGMAAFWRQFQSLLGAIGRCPVPTVAAITGHSPAGGAVLAIHTDWRVMARGPFRIGLNEVEVGLSVPEAIQFALKRLVGPHRGERLMVAGAMVESEEAHRLGMVDELAEVADVVPRALEWCRRHVALPPEAMAETRRIARADLHAALDEAERSPAEAFMDRWFSDETQATLRALVERLRKKAS